MNCYVASSNEQKEVHPMTKPLVIYHDNCADGFGAAFAAWLKLGNEADYLPWQYSGNETEEQCWERLCTATLSNSWNRDIYILDFSFKLGLMKKLFEVSNKVVWLDHHKTAFEMWCGGYEKGDRFELGPLLNGDYILLDDNKSGAMLAWEYFHPDTEVPLLIKHIDDYDRWQFKMAWTKEFNKTLWSYAPWNFEQWEALLAEYGQLCTEGAAILRAHEQNVQAIVRDASRKCDISFNWIAGPESIGLSANCPPHLASDVGHELANQSGTYGLLWHINKDGKCLCSLRSNGDYDVSAIAKAFGGGGHMNAAGFETDIHTLMEWLK